MDMWTFFDNHPFVAWCALWLLWGAVLIVYVAVGVIYRVINRTLRTIKVVVRGWPPSHLDADGDWRPQPKCQCTDKTEEERVT